MINVCTVVTLFFLPVLKTIPWQVKLEDPLPSPIPLVERAHDEQPQSDKLYHPAVYSPSKNMGMLPEQRPSSTLPQAYQFSCPPVR